MFVILLCMRTFHATFPYYIWAICYIGNFSNLTARTEDITYYQAIFETGNFNDYWGIIDLSLRNLTDGAEFRNMCFLRYL